MINYYQPFLLPFLTHKPYRLPTRVRRTYFLSFEDGLWVLLKKQHIPTGSKILVPDFYCMDVINNIRSHGYTPVFYHLDDQLTILNEKFDAYIQKHAPRVIIIFHACGITRISQKQIESLCKVRPNTLVIEDDVHKLINPKTITLRQPNHFIMDSLRKVSPLPGSFLYQSNLSTPIRPDAIHHEWKYSLSVHITYLYFRTIFIVGTIFQNAHIIQYAHEKTLKIHDDIVGDSDGGYAGALFIPYIHAFIHFDKIQQLKYSQVRLYERHLKDVLKTSPLWYQFHIPDSQKKDLHVFPLGINKNTNSICKKIESYLHTHGIVVWFKFPDSPWSKKRGILFLPLGFHISHDDIKHIIRTLSQIPADILK